MVMNALNTLCTEISIERVIASDFSPRCYSVNSR